MEDKTFVFTTELTRKLCQMKFDHDWLFKRRKQPWGEFYKILQESGEFPEEMTIDHVRKKWSYTWDTYRLAKKSRKKGWKYYKLFERHYGKTKVLDKFESWTDEWRFKLITCIAEGKEHKLDTHTLWRAVERAMRIQDMPADCCVHDIKDLWQHIKTTFARKHRCLLKKGSETTAWSLYNTMLGYYKKYEKEDLDTLENESSEVSTIPIKKGIKTKEVDSQNDENEFNWTKNITESFIQVRLQNDWLFRERTHAWKDFVNILRKEYGFPTTLGSREACRKWATVISDYQKAKATNQTSWLYYNLFELYLGEGKMSLNPLVDWQEEWVFNLISARTDLEHVFTYLPKDRNDGWREVEKRLRAIGIPLDHSLLDLAEIWSYLLRTFKWKRKFKTKGILTEQWPYYDAIASYTEKPKAKPQIARRKRATAKLEYDDDYEDDMKLFDLKQRMKPKFEMENLCRACADAAASVDVFECRDDEGTDVATKLKVVGGIEVERSDRLPALICHSCLQELENAYKFRRKCQNTDKHLRSTDHKIKLEFQNLDNVDDDIDADVLVTFGEHEEEHETAKEEVKTTVKLERKVRRKKKVRRQRYDYWKICEICGKNTKNLISHLDTHNNEKKYSCDVCDKKFKFKSGLIIHKAVHNPTPRKTCEMCGKTFHILAQYRRHFVYHLNERNFECETCGKRFNTMDILRVHNMTHTDERPFTCSECGKTFRTAGCVSRHKRIVHRNKKLIIQ